MKFGLRTETAGVQDGQAVGVLTGLSPTGGLCPTALHVGGEYVAPEAREKCRKWLLPDAEPQAAASRLQHATLVERLGDGAKLPLFPPQDWWFGHARAPAPIPFRRELFLGAEPRFAQGDHSVRPRPANHRAERPQQDLNIEQDRVILQVVEIILGAQMHRALRPAIDL